VDRLQRQEAEWEGVDCILLVQDRNQWRAPVKTAVMLRIQWMWNIWLLNF